MNRKLIIVADDFGFSEAYNLGALKARREGVATVLSLMANMDAAPHAVALAKKELPEACLVQHTNFVQGRPCSDPARIPSLVDPATGLFHRSSRWKPEQPGDAKLHGDVVPTKEDIRTETLAQLERFRALVGRFPIHFEGHSVISKAVTEAFNEIAAETGIHCMTMPEVETPAHHAAHELLFGMRGAMEMLMRGLQPEDFLNDAFGILKSPFEINILHTHPGYLDAYLLENTSLTTPRCYDLRTLCDTRVREWMQDNDVTLVDFSAVLKA